MPVIDPSRTEFGFERTVCACARCSAYCMHLPGYLIPSDLDRIRQAVAADADLLSWAKTHLLASPGALVRKGDKTFRIPTLVPARRSDGACLFLTQENRCGIHAVAPYGCSFFDAHQPGDEADRRSRRGLQAVVEAWQREELYAQVWIELYQAGLRAPPPEICRERLATGLARTGSSE